MDLAAEDYGLPPVEFIKELSRSAKLIFTKECIKKHGLTAEALGFEPETFDFTDKQEDK